MTNKLASRGKLILTNLSKGVKIGSFTNSENKKMISINCQRERKYHK
ncbi:hypothetical protein PCA01_35800 [Pseudoalteromonas carrageenovora]|nr:hypothetical protein PCA01_35800 [Pseudoalteromonas carrageenovora]